MSWLSLSNLAKQGEAFLDNLDHQAGAVIENVEKKVVHKISDSGREKAPLNNSMDRGSRHNRVSKPPFDLPDLYRPSLYCVGGSSSWIEPRF